MGEAGRARAPRYSVERLVDDVDGLYRALLASMTNRRARLRRAGARLGAAHAAGHVALALRPARRSRSARAGRPRPGARLQQPAARRRLRLLRQRATRRPRVRARAPGTTVRGVDFPTGARTFAWLPLPAIVVDDPKDATVVVAIGRDPRARADVQEHCCATTTSTSRGSRTRRDRPAARERALLRDRRRAAAAAADRARPRDARRAAPARVRRRPRGDGHRGCAPRADRRAARARRARRARRGRALPRPPAAPRRGQRTGPAPEPLWSRLVGAGHRSRARPPRHAWRTYEIRPLLEWDGWAIWGTKARALYEFGGATGPGLHERRVPAAPAPAAPPRARGNDFRAMGVYDPTLVHVQLLLLAVGSCSRSSRCCATACRSCSSGRPCSRCSQRSRC